MDRARLTRIALLVATGVIVALAVALFAYQWAEEVRLDNVGEDYRFYVGLAARFLETGVLYGERQLTGEPYHVLINIDNVYPPPSILLFVPFVFVPWPFWFGLPIAMVAYAVFRHRPAMWAWPLIALCLLWPRTQNSLIVGNSDIWSAAFVAAGTLWAWPSVLGFFKIAFAPFALIGVRQRSWWIAFGLATLVSILFAAYWIQYVVVATNWDLPLTRSLANIPILFIPVFAWLARTVGRDA